MKKVSLLIIIFILSISCQTPIIDTQNNEEDYVTSTNEVYVLKVAVIDDTPPYADLVDGEYKGLIVDIVYEAFNRMDVRFEFVTFPFNRIITLLQEGELDVATDLFINPEREEYLTFPVDTPLSVYPYALFKRKDRTIDYTGNIKSLSQYAIGYIRGYYLGSFDKYKEDPDYTLVPSDSTEGNMKQLYNCRVDLAIEVLSTGEELIKKMGYEKEIEAMQYTLGESASYVAFSKLRGLESLMEKYQETIKLMYEDGTLDQIYKKYDLSIPLGYYD